MLAHRKITLFFIHFVVCRASTVCNPEEDVWRNVPCNEFFTPENCDLNRTSLDTVKDYDRCGPAFLPLHVRNYYLATAVEGFTHQANKDAFNRIKIIPKMMRDISNNSLEISTLNQTVATPIGISPSAFHGLAHPDGEFATARAAVSAKTVMILSSYASYLLEDVAKVTQGSEARLWLMVFVMSNRSDTVNIVRRAENHGYEAIVVTVDSNIHAKVSCDAKRDPYIFNQPVPNLGGTFGKISSQSMTFYDITWLKSITKLPVVAKGILSGEDARKAIEFGASAIMVSNHGGRQMDFSPATIDALPEVVDAVKDMHPRPDVYMDGGVRSGYDVYKAIARGAKMVFIGRPVLWALAIAGQKGVERVLDIMTDQFNETMLLAGATNPSNIRKDTIKPLYPIDC